MTDTKELRLATDPDFIAEAITDYWGERCGDFNEGCACCQAWAQYDAVRKTASAIERLEAERDEALKHVELLQDKFNAPQECACAYDSPHDVCMHHSPMLVAAEAQRAPTT